VAGLHAHRKDTVHPRRFEATGSIAQEVTLEATEPRSGELRATAQAGDARQEIVFDLAPGKPTRDVFRLGRGGVGYSWGYRLRGGEERSGDVTTGASFHAQDDIVCGGVTRAGLFSHPPYQGGVGYSYADFEPIPLPDEPCELHVWVGIKDGGHVSDGVDFIVEATPEGGERTEIARVNTGERSWRELSADLSPFRGKRVGIRLVADVGPRDNSTSDWASWGEPTIRLLRSIPVLEVRPRRR